MKKLFLFTWMMMLSIVAMAQTIIVVDKDGNRVPYDPSKIISVEFQNTPPGFSINMNGMSIPYTFEVVKSIQGNPNFVFVDPETVKVNGEGEDLAVQVKANVDFNVTTSASWITFDTEAKDGLQYVKVAMNPSVEERTAKVTLTSKDGTLTSTLNVVQAGKEDSRYIDIDWEKDHLDSFDAETGETKITFADAVPIMGEYDVVLLPTESGSLTIRVINEVAKTEGKTVTLKTEKGDMGNLFRDEKFTLDFDMTGNEANNARTRAAAADGAVPVYYPVSVEEFDGEKFVEIYNAEKSKTRATRAPKDNDDWFSYSATGEDIYKNDHMHLKWKHHLVKLNLHGKTTLEFKKEQWWKVWKGTTVEHSLTSEGNIYNELELECHNDVCEQQKSQISTKILKKDAIWRVFNFRIGEKKIPLKLQMKVDISSQYNCEANGIIDMTASVAALSTVKYGYILKGENPEDVQWYKDCTTEYDNLNEPSLQVADINANQYMKATAVSYPYYRFSFYDDIDRFFQIQQRQDLSVEGYGRKVDNKYSAMNLIATTESKVYSTLDIKDNRSELDQSIPNTKKKFLMPHTIFHYDSGVTDVLVGDVRELKFRVDNRGWNNDDYPAKGMMLVKLTCENGLFVDMNNADGSSTNNAVETYQYIDKDGFVTCKFKQTSEDKPGRVTAEVILGNPNEKDTYIYKAFEDLYLHKYEIQCLTPEVEIEKGQTATIQYQINHYVDGELINNHIMPNVDFIAEGGTVSPLKMTDENVEAAKGKLTVTFTPDENATEGKVGAQPTLEYKQMKWLGASIAHITIKGGGGDDDIKDNDLKKAKKLDDNTYVIDDKVTKLDGPEDEMVWTTYEDNEGNKTNSLYWFKEDPVYYTTAWGTIYGFTEDMFGEEIYWSDGSGLSINLGAFIDPSAGYNESNVIEFNSENIEKAVFKLTKNADGSIDALAYFRSKDGKEGAFKVKAKPAAPSNARNRAAQDGNAFKQTILQRMMGKGQ